MQTLNALLKRNIITELVFRDISESIRVGEYDYIEDGLLKYGVTSEQIKDVRSDIFNLPKYSAADIDIDKDVSDYFTEDFCRENRVVPLAGGIIGVLDPEKKDALKLVEGIAMEYKLQYKLEIISKEEYLKAFMILSESNAEDDREEKDGQEGLVLHDVSRVNVDTDKKQVDDITKDRVDLEEFKDKINDVPIGKLVNSVLYEAIQKEASDIHMEHTGEHSRVRLRIDGVLESIIEVNPRLHQSLVARIKILSDMKLDEKRKPQDGRFSVRIKNGGTTHKIDFRVSTMPSYYGEKVVMRILDSYRGIRKLENVGFSDKHLSQIRKALGRPYGIIMISGPTGSGKTTTLYSMLNELDREHKNVVSLEDPIEYNVGNMNQSQIFPEIGYTFATGLRSILRQDPDVIMVGEIRDKETAELAIQAALTGHLVFSTIHTNNSIGVITRLMDMGVDPYLIAPTMILAIAQRLSPMIAPGCAYPMEMTAAVKNLVDIQFKDLKDEYRDELKIDRPFYEAVTSETSPVGIKGRMPILEVLEIDDDLQEAILARKSEDDMYNIARDKGMVFMREDAMLKSMDGKVPFVEIAGL